MKLLLVAAIALGIQLSPKAEAARSTCMDMSGCSATVTTDSGTGKRCEDSDYSCSCESMSCHRWTITSNTYCPSSYSTFMGLTVTGQKCCHDFKTQCQRGNEEQIAQEEVQGEKAELEDVFANSLSRSMSYYGYLNSSPRSPITGRAARAAAMLDICLSETHAPGSSWQNCYTNCGDSAKNGYCLNNGYNNDGNGTSFTAASVCKDRCDCTWGEGVCEGF